MRTILRLFSAIVLAGGALQAWGGLETAAAQAPTKQIKLTEKQITAFIAAQGKMDSAKADADLEAVAKEFGFAGIEEHDDVEANILLLMDGIDPQTKAFTEPPVLIKRRIEETKADQTLPAAERAQTVEELSDALKSARPIEFPANIELVRKYYDKLQAVLE